jgi:S-adenosylmethionine-diacylglycerol 3-amino-3-carboxypropyl transferase
MQIKDLIFQKIHGNTLVYNTCWEDPRCDRSLLNFDTTSRVVMLTSAGCNALDYLLDQVKSIDCVDMNLRQNALLDLKLSVFKSGNYNQLWKLFGQGFSSDANSFYQNQLRHILPTYAQAYWDKAIDGFSSKGLRGSFYFRGSSGTLAFLLKRYLQLQPNCKQAMRRLFEPKSIQDQRDAYLSIEPRLLGKISSWLLNRHIVQSMAGVPESQQKMAKEAYSDGMTGYIRACFRHVFMENSIYDNYFWKLYFYGFYTPECCPNYLKESNFEKIQSETNKINTHTSTLSEFLIKNPEKYTHFVLLDHQDWLAANKKAALLEEWELILANSAPGAKVLLRSAAPNRLFLPEIAQKSIQFQDEKVKELHHQDRVGTYASTHLGVLKNL